MKLQVDFSSFGFAKYLRAAALMVNGVEPVELNPNFMEDLFKAAAGKGIIIYDEIGGTLEPTATFGNGKTSRSLLAVYQVSLVLGFSTTFLGVSLSQIACFSSALCMMFMHWKACRLNERPSAFST